MLWRVGYVVSVGMVGINGGLMVTAVFFAQPLVAASCAIGMIAGMFAIELSKRYPK